MAEMTRITVSLPKDLHRKARIKAAETGIPMSAVCRQALAAWAQEEGSRPIKIDLTWLEKGSRPIDLAWPEAIEEEGGQAIRLKGPGEGEVTE